MRVECPQVIPETIPQTLEKAIELQADTSSKVVTAKDLAETPGIGVHNKFLLDIAGNLINSLTTSVPDKQITVDEIDGMNANEVIRRHDPDPEMTVLILNRHYNANQFEIYADGTDIIVRKKF